MLRYIAEEQLPHRVTLVYSNRDRDSAAFLDELFELERDNPNLRLVLTMTDESTCGRGRRGGSTPTFSATIWGTSCSPLRT
ncbi:MAG: hypothetical protein H0W87_00525 [Actinobacteria bacterium]|nr:hypothetical protein [Actinomycetota bacterium]